MKILAKSIIKQYINGEITLNEFDKFLKKQNISFINENIKKNEMNNNNNNNLNNMSDKKRMSLVTDKFRHWTILDKNMFNLIKDLNSEKTINKTNNCISGENNENINFYKKNNNCCKNKENIEDCQLSNEIFKNNEIFLPIKNEDKTIIFNYLNKKNNNINYRDNNYKEKTINVNYIKNEKENKKTT